MKKNSRDKAEKFWDRTAKNYDKEEEKDKRIYKQIIERTKRYLRSTDTVLDLGCGTGLVSNKISKYVKKIDAIDLSSKMIEIARAKALKSDIQNINYLHSTVFSAQLKLASYDVILCFYVLHLLGNQQEVIKKIHGLLKPDGILVSVTPCVGEKPIQDILFSLLNKLGIVPNVTLLKRFDLEGLFQTESFSIIENECLSKTTSQFFMVLKK